MKGGVRMRKLAIGTLVVSGTAAIAAAAVLIHRKIMRK